MNNDLIKRLNKAYDLAAGELADHPLHQSQHWQAINNQVKRLFTNQENWKNFRRNAISLGLDDANPHSTVSQKRAPGLEDRLTEVCQEFGRVAGPEFSQLLDESLVGNPITYRILEKNVTINTPALVYLAWRLGSWLAELRNEFIIFIEIGGGYGGLTRILKHLFPKAKFMLFDLPEANAIATYFLQENFKDAGLYLLPDLRAGVKLDWQKTDFVILPGWCLQSMNDRSAHVVINTRSMMEMTKKAIAAYFNEIQRVLKPGGVFYCVNRHYKRIGEEEIILAEYPFDGFWNFVYSNKMWLQPGIGELLAQRLSTPNPDYPYAVLRDLPRDLPPNLRPSEGQIS